MDSSPLLSEHISVIKIINMEKARKDHTLRTRTFEFNALNIGIKHGFSCINIRQVPREVLKTEPRGRGFQHLPIGTWRILMH